MTYATPTELQRRTRVAHGWAFRRHTAAERRALRRYLAGEDPDALRDLPASYRRLHATVR